MKAAVITAPHTIEIAGVLDLFDAPEAAGGNAA